jgi:dTDP-L-rhamnose 4-epimerase
VGLIFEKSYFFIKKFFLRGTLKLKLVEFQSHPRSNSQEDHMSKGKVLVTGGAGFIGSYVVDKFIETGFDVRVLDNLEPQVHGDEESGSDGWPLYANRNAELVLGDIRNLDLVKKCLDGVTHVVHLAGLVGVGQSMIQVIRYTSSNDLGTATVLEAISKAKQVERIVVASSISIYGESLYKNSRGDLIAPPMRSAEQLKSRQWDIVQEGEVLIPVATKEDKELLPPNIYAVGKYVTERESLIIGQALGIPTIPLRFFNTYGPRQALSNPYTGVAAIFASRLLNNQSPLIYEDGKQRRDFIDVKDVARAVTMITSSTKQVWEPYNVGTGKYVTIEYIAKCLADLMKKNIKPTIIGKYRVGNIRHCYSDSTKIAKAFGFSAEIPFEDGMANYIQWLAGQKSKDRQAECVSLLTDSNLVV